MTFSDYIDFIKYLETIAKGVDADRVSATEAATARAAASVEHMAEAAAYEVGTLVRYLASLSADAALEAADADAPRSEELAQETIELTSRLLDLVTPEVEMIDEKRARLIVDEANRVSERAIETSSHADRNRYDIRSAADALRIAVDALVKHAKIRIYEPTSEPPTHLVEVVSGLSAQLIEYLRSHPWALFKLSSSQFEEFIAEMLAGFGWEVQLTKATKDGGYDIFAITKDTQVGVSTSWIIECKRNSLQRKIGVDIVRSLYGLKLDLRVANAMIATTSHFTDCVQEYKKSRYDLELKDYEGIIEWLNTYRPNPNGKLYIRNNQLVSSDEG